MKAEVIPGQVQVNHVACTHRGADFAVMEIDCAHKYIEAGSYSSSPEVSLWCTERTPQPYDPEAPGTIVRLPEEFRGWDLVTDWARYTVRVVLYSRRDVEADVEWLWTRRDDDEAEQGDRPGDGEQPAADVGEA